MVLASRGTRNFDDGEAPVEDAVLAGQLRRRGLSILQMSAGLAVAGAALLYFLPV